MVLNLKNITVINSIGVKHWYESIPELQSHGKSLEYQECSFCFIWQCSLIPAMRKNIKITSFETEFYCEECDEETSKMLIVDQLDLDHLPPKLPCPHCNAIMTAERQRIFEFLKE